MVAYSFRARFAAPILAKTKIQTIRADRKRHARPGETLQLYTGMRTRQCRLIGLATCVLAEPIRLDFQRDVVEYLDSGMRLAAPEELAMFAGFDGFDSWADLRAFWATEHPGLPVFSGVRIFWAQTFRVGKDG